MIRLNGNRYECDDPHVEKVWLSAMTSVTAVSQIRLNVLLKNGNSKTFWSMTGEPDEVVINRLIQEAEAWLATLPATDRGYEGL